MILFLRTLFENYVIEKEFRKTIKELSSQMKYFDIS